MWYICNQGCCSGGHWQVVCHGGPHPPPTYAKCGPPSGLNMYARDSQFGGGGGDEKGEIRLECAAAMHLRRKKGWETPIDECVHTGGWKGDMLQNNSG